MSLKQVSEHFVDAMRFYFVLKLRVYCLGIHNADDTTLYSLALVMPEDQEIRSKNIKGELS